MFSRVWLRWLFFTSVFPSIVVSCSDIQRYSLPNLFSNVLSSNCIQSLSKTSSNATGNANVTSEPSKSAIPSIGITPPRYTGLRVIRKGPSVVNPSGMWSNSIVLFVSFIGRADHTFRDTSSRIRINPEYTREAERFS